MVGYYRFILISSGEGTFHFIDLVIFGNYWKERDEKSLTNEVTPSYCGLFSDVACIGYFLVNFYQIVCVLVVSIFLILTQVMYILFF